MYVPRKDPDPRTLAQLKIDRDALPVLRLQGPNRFVYVGKDQDGKPYSIDPRVFTFRQHPDFATFAAQAFRMMRVEDFVPAAILDGKTGLGGARFSREATTPKEIRKIWQRKYAIAMFLNRSLDPALTGKAFHFEVNDAWDHDWDPGRPFDLRRALVLRCTHLELQAAEELALATDRELAAAAITGPGAGDFPLTGVEAATRRSPRLRRGPGANDGTEDP